MGEYAEMRLDGTCCEACGEFLHTKHPTGYPTYCSACKTPFACAKCGKSFSSGHSLRQHVSMKHFAGVEDG
jgi:hypothetical protein